MRITSTRTSRIIPIPDGSPLKKGRLARWEYPDRASRPCSADCLNDFSLIFEGISGKHMLAQ